jgi:hypothetical protein
MKKRLPVGIQSFSRLRNEGCLYVDKTQHIYNMISTSGGIYFLARPRRFGKSLLVGLEWLSDKNLRHAVMS